jgi:hypothetical protein
MLGCVEAAEVGMEGERSAGDHGIIQARDDGSLDQDGNNGGKGRLWHVLEVNGQVS